MSATRPLGPVVLDEDAPDPPEGTIATTRGRVSVIETLWWWRDGGWFGLGLADVGWTTAQVVRLAGTLWVLRWGEHPLSPV